jgi:1-acyl-sn-glycerol-3-phosphate acyltransferase
MWYRSWKFLIGGMLELAFSLRFEGGRNVPRQGPALLVSNHESFLDPLAIGVACPRHLRYLARDTLFKNPLLGRFLRSVGVVPLDREGVAKEGIKTILAELASGKPVLLFPEGNRTRTGEMQPLRGGIQLLIKRSLAPVVPVGIAGTYQTLSAHDKVPKLSPLFLPATGSAFAVVFGKPLDGATLGAMPREQLLETLFQAIVEMREKAHRLRRKQ